MKQLNLFTKKDLGDVALYDADVIIKDVGTTVKIYTRNKATHLNYTEAKILRKYLDTWIKEFEDTCQLSS